jgi:hypothetical protein
MDYKNGKIYKIVDIGYNKMYIGSTTQPLYKRFSNHKAKYNQFKSGKGHKYSIFDIFDEFGIENCKIELIEEYQCENKSQLERKEGEHIKINKCMNKIIVGRTNKEYFIDNKNKINERNRKYYEKNKNILNEKNKEYHKEYYNKNKNKFIGKIKCECGCEYQYSSKSKHVKTKIHLNFTNKTNML